MLEAPVVEQRAVVALGRDLPVELPVEPVVVVVDAEAGQRGYDDLARGLIDRYRAAGTGFATTWRPGVADAPILPFGLLRIDMACADPM
jgi:hypothetical protein